MRSLDPLFAFPGVFVPGNNDYYVPRLKNPFRYFVRRHERIRGPRLPWAELAAIRAEGKVRELGVALGPAIGWVEEGLVSIRDRDLVSLQTAERRLNTSRELICGGFYIVT